MPADKHPEQDPAEGSRSVIDRNLAQNEKSSNQGEEGKTTSPEKDSKGQFVQSKHGAENDGVTSADPQVFSGKRSGDATWPLKQDQDN